MLLPVVATNYSEVHRRASYWDENVALENIPTLKMIATELQTLEDRARDLLEGLSEKISGSAKIKIVDGSSMVGGGSLPMQSLPTKLLAISSTEVSAARLEAHFRGYIPPIIGRVEQELFLLDVRTLQPGDEAVIVAAASQLDEAI